MTVEALPGEVAGGASPGNDVIVAVLGEVGEVVSPEAGVGAGAHREGEADPAGVHRGKQQSQDLLATAFRHQPEEQVMPKEEVAPQCR